MASHYTTDVDKLLAALERVIGFHHLSDEVEQKIKKGYCEFTNLYCSIGDT